jgi:hypothetical protein
MSGRDPKTKPMDWRVIVLMGAGDIVIGLVLVACALAGLVDDGNRTLLISIGAVMAVVGAALVIWARSKVDGGAG